MRPVRSIATMCDKPDRMVGTNENETPATALTVPGRGRTRGRGPTMSKRTRPKIKPELRLSIYRRDNYTCKSCGDVFPPDRTEASGGKYAPEIPCPDSWTGEKYLELDHVVPHSRGGGSGPDNLRSLCTPCNKSKLAKTHEMFWPERIAEAVKLLEGKPPSKHVAERAAEILLGEFHDARGPMSR